MNPVLVSVASHARENYNLAQLRLIRSSVDSGWSGDYLLRSVDGYCDEYFGAEIKLGSWPITKKYGVSWQHADCPYRFKPFAIQEAREKGYTKILWCDSSIRIVRNPEPLWAIAKEQGIVAFNNWGFPLKDWICDWAIGKLLITHAEVETMPQIMACCIMFDFDHPITQKIFDLWIYGSLNGSFDHNESSNPTYRGTRHDQAYLSALLAMHNVPLLPYGNLVYPPYDRGETFEGHAIFFVNRGIN